MEICGPWPVLPLCKSAVDLLSPGDREESMVSNITLPPMVDFLMRVRRRITSELSFIEWGESEKSSSKGEDD